MIDVPSELMCSATKDTDPLRNVDEVAVWKLALPHSLCRVCEHHYEDGVISVDIFKLSALFYIEDKQNFYFYRIKLNITVCVASNSGFLLSFVLLNCECVNKCDDVTSLTYSVLQSFE